MSKPRPLDKRDLHIINEALALLEAEVDADDYYTPSASHAVKRVRGRVHDLIEAGTGGFNPALGLGRTR